MAKRNHLTCRHPDRDSPKLMCGYPLPCPYHTVTIDLSSKPTTIIVPITRGLTYEQKRNITEIAEILDDNL